jgi:hypothetical protein
MSSHHCHNLIILSFSFSPLDVLAAWCCYPKLTWLCLKLFFYLFYFFGVPHLATFIFEFFLNVIASIPYIHPVYSAGVWTHNLLVMSYLPKPLDHGFSPSQSYLLCLLIPKWYGTSKSDENWQSCKKCFSLDACRQSRNGGRASEAWLQCHFHIIITGIVFAFSFILIFIGIATQLPHISHLLNL